MPRTIKDILQNSIVSKLDTKIIIKHFTGLNDIQIILNDGLELEDKVLELINTAIQLSDDGYPIAYIVKHKEFYSRTFSVNEATLIPRPETELLVEQVLALAPSGSKILDMGTGSGCIAITLNLENSTYVVDAVDISMEALAVAKVNAETNGALINFYHSNWFGSVRSKYDIIVSNPPYIEQNDSHLGNLKFEPLNALTDYSDGLSCYREIIKEASNYLSKGGYLIFEHGYNQADAIRVMFDDFGYSGIVTIQDYSGNDRVSYANI